METDRNSQLLISLIYTFQMQAMMQMGKLKNPITEKVDRDLESARMSIDMLEMISEKTRNNLSEEENRFLTQILSDLKLNFVEESAKPQEKAEEQKPEEIKPEETKQ
jgi:hypothetical protein